MFPDIRTPSSSRFESPRALKTYDPVSSRLPWFEIKTAAESIRENRAIASLLDRRIAIARLVIYGLQSIVGTFANTGRTLRIPMEIRDIADPPIDRFPLFDRAVSATPMVRVN